MSLFLQLQHLYRSDRFLLEDFHTEIVAQVLRNLPGLTLSWLRSLEVTNLMAVDSIQIATQETYAKLSWHECDSRPDMVIRLEHGGETELVFVESKLPSQQGYDQLQRYADHLNVARLNRSVSRASLVFVTRDYESLPDALAADPHCRLTRWFHFYHHLKRYGEGDTLARELALFMQHNRMSLGNKITAIDLVALENFIHAKQLLDETLGGEVFQAAGQLLGKGTYKGLDDIHEDPRYVVQFGAWWQEVVFLFGYWFPLDDPDASLWLGLKVYSNPAASSCFKIREFFRVWDNGDAQGWTCSPQVEGKWATLSKGRSLQSFLGEADHIRAIKNYFLTVLQEAQVFQTTLASLAQVVPQPGG